MTATALEMLNAHMAGAGRPGQGDAHWQRYLAPVAVLSHDMPVPILGFMLRIWHMREHDLQVYFPLHTQQGKRDFIAWCILHGQREYRAFDSADLFWKAVDSPVSAGQAQDPDDPLHALSWRIVLLTRGRRDLGCDSGTRQERAALLLWYLEHGSAEFGEQASRLRDWQLDFLRAPSAHPGLNRLQALVHAARPDVGAAFPLPQALPGYLDWFAHFVGSATGIAMALGLQGG